MRTREWDQLVAPQLTNALPGTWTIRSGYLSHVPGEGHLAWHVSRQVTRGGGYRFHAVIQPLYVVSDVVDRGLGEILGHGDPGVRAYFTEDEPDAVPVEEIQALIQRFALPHFERFGRGLSSFLKLVTSFAKIRPHQRGTWSTEAWTAGAHTLLDDWKRARNSWQDCLLELAQFDDDHAPDLRRLAAQAVDAKDAETRAAIVAWLGENENEMKGKWNLG